MQKFIRSRRTRVKKAKLEIKKIPEKITMFDREAFIKFYLLEDIFNLCKFRLLQEKNKKNKTRAGEISTRLNIEKFTAIINIFESAIEVARGEITSANYKAVWKAINERALMIAAGSLKNLPELRDLAVELLKELSDEAVKATEHNMGLNDDLDFIVSHEANVRHCKDLPTPEEIDAVIKAGESDIADKKAKSNRLANN